jgi:hypothetical protein
MKHNFLPETEVRVEPGGSNHLTVISVYASRSVDERICRNIETDAAKDAPEAGIPPIHLIFIIFLKDWPSDPRRAAG